MFGELVFELARDQLISIYMLEVSRDLCKFELKDQESQGMFRPAGEGATDYRYVVMPMRL